MKNLVLCGMLVVAFACSAPETEQIAEPQTNSEQESVVDAIMLTSSQARLANISLSSVGSATHSMRTPISGRLMVNPERSTVVSSRVAGRIERLFVKQTGQRITLGQPLYTIYSEELLVLQREYLMAKEQHDRTGDGHYRNILNAAEQKLLLYGLTRQQIRALSKGQPDTRVIFSAPASGIVTAVDVTEGEYVDEGSSLFRLDDISNLWVEAELYPSELGLVKLGDSIRVYVTGRNTDEVRSIVSYLSPEFKNRSQVAVLRANVDNRSGAWHPGQRVQVMLGGSNSRSLVMPVDAVIRDEYGAHVYVASGPNTFVPRRVRLGAESEREVEIVEGLAEQDTVAVTGAYLLYSEYVLKKGRHPIAITSQAGSR